MLKFVNDIFEKHFMKIVVNSTEKEVRDNLSVSDLLNDLEINRHHVAVEVNLDLITREQHEDYLISDGDRIEIVTLVGGG